VGRQGQCQAGAVGVRVHRGDAGLSREHGGGGEPGRSAVACRQPQPQPGVADVDG